MVGKRGWAVTRYFLWLARCCVEGSTKAVCSAQNGVTAGLRIPAEDQINDVVLYANSKIKSVILRS